MKSWTCRRCDRLPPTATSDKIPVPRTLRLSKQRLAHTLYLELPDALNAHLERWLREAHKLAIARNTPGTGHRPAK